MAKDYKYVISTGWWCGSEDETNSVGIKKTEFVELWSKSIEKFTNPEKIFVVDSNSPVKPKYDNKFISSKLEYVSLLENAGHSANPNHLGLYCGWTRAVLMGVEYAHMCDVDYYVYVEQDSLLYGENIIEHAISKMTKPYMFGDAKGLGHPLQISFFIIHKSKFKDFINSYKELTVKDNVISPEKKICISTSKMLQIIPQWIYEIYEPDKPRLLEKIKIRIYVRLMNYLGNFNTLPFGYGGYSKRTGVNFDDKYFYFQHASKDEIDKYIKLIGEL
jgi:hypothetical protein